MERIIIDSNEVSSYIKIMSNHINNLIEHIKVMSNLKKSLNWTSDNCEKSLLLYDELIKNYLSFTNKMIKFIEYLTGFLDSYDDSLNEIKMSFKTIGNEYDIEDL